MDVVYPLPDLHDTVQEKSKQVISYRSIHNHCNRDYEALSLQSPAINNYTLLLFFFFLHKNSKATTSLQTTTNSVRALQNFVLCSSDHTGAGSQMFPE